jgi:hypothetical protein
LLLIQQEDSLHLEGDYFFSGQQTKRFFSFLWVFNFNYDLYTLTQLLNFLCLCVGSKKNNRKKGLYIVDLEDPWETSKTLHQKGKWEVAVVQWNPHPNRSKLIASAVFFSFSMSGSVWGRSSSSPCSLCWYYDLFVRFVCWHHRIWVVCCLLFVLLVE